MHDTQEIFLGENGELEPSEPAPLDKDGLLDHAVFSLMVEQKVGINTVDRLLAIPRAEIRRRLQKLKTLRSRLKRAHAKEHFAKKKGRSKPRRDPPFAVCKPISKTIQKHIQAEHERRR